ncbi:MAG: PqqD family protein [Clostridiales bacterium]|nr:PqqD family protein [Clostridiales bacterium]MBQ3046739.1 PqqD family protein [Clostridia bacterium]
MKIKEGFILREVAGSYIVVAVGSAVKEFNGVINLNETGAFLWKILEKGAEKEDLISALLAEYEVEEELATKDIEKFIEKLESAKLIK